VISLTLWSKLSIHGRYAVLAGNIYNLKTVEVHLVCIAEQNVSQDRTWDKFNNKTRYLTQI